MLLDYLAREIADRGYRCLHWVELSQIQGDNVRIRVAVTLICPCGRSERLEMTQNYLLDFCAHPAADEVIRGNFLHAISHKFDQHLAEFNREFPERAVPGNAVSETLDASNLPTV